MKDWSKHIKTIERDIARGNIDGVDTQLRTLEQEVRRSGNAQGKAWLLLLKARLAGARNRYADAVSIAQKAFQAAENLQDRNLLAKVHVLLSGLYLRTGHYEKAKAHAEAASYFAKWEMRDPILERDSYNNLGLACKNLGLWADAERNLRTALEITSDEADLTSRLRVASNLGILLRKEGKLDEAERLCTEVLDLAERCKATILKCRMKLELANISIIRRDFDACKDCLNDAQRIAEEHGYAREMIIANEIRGDLRAATGESTDALDIYMETVSKVRASYPGTDLECELLRRVAAMNLRLGRVSQARACVEKGLMLAKKLQDLYEVGIYLRILGEVSLREGLASLAMSHLRQSIETLSSLSSWSHELALSEFALGKAMAKCESVTSRGDALVHLLSSRRIFSSLGISLLVRQVDEIVSDMMSHTPPCVVTASSLVPKPPSTADPPMTDLARYGIVTADERIAGDLKQWGATDVRVLIEGETGVGKELLARAMHRMSRRREEPFVVIDCGSLSETLAESELFGHARGAFTGAVRERVGLIESANGGTLLLDEVGELSEGLQVKLLRVLEEGSVRRVGSNEQRKIDIRVLSATTRDLWAEVEAGRFRKDLYYRLKGVLLRIPSLRERPYDIEILVDHYLDQYCTSYGVRVTLTEEARQRLLTYTWPGNVRELKNVIEALVAIGRSRVIQPSDLDQFLGTYTHSRLLEQAEKDAIRLALKQARGNRTKAARILGISRGTLWHRMRSLGME